MLKNMATKNVGFRQGDIEKRIPVENNSVDVVTGNCVANLASKEVNVFRGSQDIKTNKRDGKMIISDLVSVKEAVDADGLRILTDSLLYPKPCLFH